ncbi:hypothetical protein CBF68_07270 [Lactobacillus taiwanensis]|uniref:helix-turn-helix domain-containing protein n=1 Tax=Lactobacillus taiwanensis TaxID=508451 RepID=UPI000B98E0D0|nr:helix-turn-helix transcriptional regulator [Lactobacillus taiwanensis]OYS00019.1 hypothetical protein CBF64_01660 [Lactobacillus taiwanensis]OYS03314.1 hypothetical protein CBF68_07270 [Lactobacillus taiwanensis]
MEYKDKIGETLKKERKLLGLTQDQFIHGIISKSFYSKVERGLNEISASDLFSILEVNKISLDDFMNNLKDNSSKENDLEIKLVQAFYAQNKAEITDIYNTIIKSNYSERLKLTAILVKATIEKSLLQLDSSIKRRIKKGFFEVDNWTTNINMLQIFCNSMLLFDQDELDYHFKQLFKFYRCKLSGFSFHTQKLVGTICINYLQNCYLNQEGEYREKAYELIDDLALIPDLGMFRIIKNYYKYWFNHDSIKYRSIRKFLIDNGLEEFVHRLP